MQSSSLIVGAIALAFIIWLLDSCTFQVHKPRLVYTEEELSNLQVILSDYHKCDNIHRYHNWDLRSGSGVNIYCNDYKYKYYVRDSGEIILVVVGE